jgi:hypothetical protein
VLKAKRIWNRGPLRELTMAGQPDDDRTRIILGFAAVSAIFVIIVMIILLVGLVGSRVIRPAQPAGTNPYGVAQRPLPTASQLAELLPDKLGSFKRTSLSGSLADFSATYADGKDVVTIQGSQAVSTRAAQASLSMTASSIGSSGYQQLNADPSFVLQTSEKGTARFVWSHSRWYFDVTAPSKALLDAFMQEFQY